MIRDHKAMAYALLRVALGINMFGHGFFRILSGVGAFAHGMVVGMDKGPLPHALSLGFGYCIPWIELAIGICLLTGFCTRFALAAGALFIVALTFGTTSTQNWQGAGGQLCTASSSSFFSGRLRRIPCRSTHGCAGGSSCPV